MHWEESKSKPLTSPPRGPGAAPPDAAATFTPTQQFCALSVLPMWGSSHQSQLLLVIQVSAPEPPLSGDVSGLPHHPHFITSLHRNLHSLYSTYKTILSLYLMAYLSFVSPIVGG